MANLEDLEWGDVLVDTGDVLVAQAELDGEPVLVKRWSAGALDGELRARQLLAAAGVATAELLAHGPGWLVLEDLDSTMWRPAHRDELTQPAVLEALACWFAAAHAVDPQDLPGDPTSAVLRPEVVHLAADELPPELGPRLPAAVTGWQELLAGEPRCVSLGVFEPSQLRVVGAGLDAMPTDLASCHAGCAATDLALVRSVLLAEAGESAWHRFATAYGEAARRDVDHAVVDAAAGLTLATSVVVSALTQPSLPITLRDALVAALAR